MHSGKQKINNAHHLSHTHFTIKPFFQAYYKALQSKAISFEHPIVKFSVMNNFLKCLLKETRISGYHFLRTKQKVIIFLSHDLVKKTPLMPKLTFYFSHGRIQIASLKTLQDFHRLNPTALTLINTIEGIMTLKDCLQKKCGGQLLVTII